MTEPDERDENLYFAGIIEYLRTPSERITLRHCLLNLNTGEFFESMTARAVGEHAGQVFRNLGLENEVLTYDDCAVPERFRGQRPSGSINPQGSTVYYSPWDEIHRQEFATGFRSARHLSI